MEPFMELPDFDTPPLIPRRQLDTHLSGFRKSPEFRRFFEAVGPFVNDIEEMRHYQVTLASTLEARS
jgi:hypothetical protein